MIRISSSYSSAQKALLLGCLLVLIPSLSTGADRVRSEVQLDFQRYGKACACVALDVTCRPDASLEERCERYSQAQERLLARLPRDSYALHYRYRYSPVLVLEIRSPEAMTVLEQAPGVTRVETDLVGSGALVESRQLIRADEVFDLPVTGERRVVAVLDTGVLSSHPDLQDPDGQRAVIHEHHFYRDSLNQRRFVGAGALDGHGHGTHITGIIASRGRFGPRGVAPGARVVAVKVLNDENVGWVGDWAAGVEHVVELHKANNGIRVDVINMALETKKRHPGVCDVRCDLPVVDPESVSLMALTCACLAAQREGIAIFAASGNRGSIEDLPVPACLSSVYSVGAVGDPPRDSVSVCFFTNRTELLDLLAPGKFITSLDRIVDAQGNYLTATFSGTSFAVPHAAALACLLREVGPDLPPDEMLGIMKRTGFPVVDEVLSGFLGRQISFPRIDALAAVADVSASGPRFVRAECNGDGAFDISDPVFVLRALFLGKGASLKCQRACDADDNGELNISDAVYTLGVLFLGNSPPLPPYPACGGDPTPDTLTCNVPHCL